MISQLIFDYYNWHSWHTSLQGIFNGSWAWGWWRRPTSTCLRSSLWETWKILYLPYSVTTEELKDASVNGPGHLNTKISILRCKCLNVQRGWRIWQDAPNWRFFFLLSLSYHGLFYGCFFLIANLTFSYMTELVTSRRHQCELSNTEQCYQIIKYTLLSSRYLLMYYLSFCDCSKFIFSPQNADAFTEGLFWTPLKRSKGALSQQLFHNFSAWLAFSECPKSMGISTQLEW